jgi:uncharacterized delta-60 repeat protein
MLHTAVALACFALLLATPGAFGQSPTCDAFNPGANGSVYSMAVQADGKILVGGIFISLGGQPRNYIGRLNADGTLDEGFNPGADNSVSSLAVQADGRILVGGYFISLGGQPRNYIGRLNADGTLDEGFNPGAGSSVSTLAVQADGKILVGGNFTYLGKQPRNYIGRLNADGTLDEGFNPGAGSSVSTLAVQADGKIVVGGLFTSLGGQQRNHVGRLNATGSSTHSLTLSDSTVTWLRGGTSPEVSRAVLDWSGDGLRWNSLGEGFRVPGGWLWTNASANTQATIRARGFAAGGYRNSSGWFVEDYWGPLVWIAQPASRTNDAGSAASLGGVAGGTPPLSYQWFKNGLAITDGAHIAGASTSWLSLNNVLGADAGGYYLVASNAYGIRTSVVATLTVNDPLVAVPPVSQNRQAGESATLSVTVLGTAPMSYQWWKNGAALAGRTDASLTLSNLVVTDAGSYSVVVTNVYGIANSTVALLAVNAATLDEGFNPGAGNSVSSLAVQADGRILVGGNFTTLGGERRNYIGRLNVDGTLDVGFNPGASNSVYSLVVEADGRILVGGNFTSLGGQSRNYLGRLNVDGTLDAGFNPRADRPVLSLALQADGKIVVGGDFTTLGGERRNYLGRLNVDGTLDAGFNPGANGSVSSLALQADGKIVVGGNFTSLGGQPRSRIGRLNVDGTLDAGFNPGASYSVYSLAVQADGKIVVGGGFTTLGGQTRHSIGRLNADGTLDTAFNPGAGGIVYSLAVQADGKILVGGSLPTLGGEPRSRIGRLNPDGTLDSGFNPGASFIVHSLAVQADGKVLVGGDFTTLGGLSRYYLGRLNAIEPATQSLIYDGSTISWLRGGTSPEVWRTAFDWSSDGQLWTPLGEGTRLPGGWQCTNAMLPERSTLRARGFVAETASSWFVEAYWGAPVWSTHPVNRTNDAGSTATFNGLADGTPPLSYQWFKNGVLALDGAHITGTTTSKLTITNVMGADTGGYYLVVSNAYGMRTSLVATLTVDEPIITTHPTNQARQSGENVTMSVGVRGTEPLTYQWWREGVPLTGRTGPSITLTNLGAGDAGRYLAVVSGSYGSATSSVAWLTVNRASLDTGFNPGASGSTYALAIQPDGKILMGGDFYILGGQLCSRIGRLNADGTLDSGFDSGANSSVRCLAVQTDGKILVGGDFSTLGGQSRDRIGRLNADGTVDSGFNPSASSIVSSLAIQADGKILVGGDFNMLGGQPRSRIGRLNVDGTLDPGFNPGANSSVRCLAVQADGKILVGGDFNMLGGQPRFYIGRLNADGGVDSGFYPSASFLVSSLAVQADGKILVGGAFTTLGGRPRSRIGRLNADGTLDAGFDPGANSSVVSLAVQADGRILMGGDFTTLGGQIRDCIARLNVDGSVDAEFAPGASGSVKCLAVQADGKILVGGGFGTLCGQACISLGRLNATAPATQSLSYDGSTITWLRGGTSPEVWHAVFEWSSDGLLWIPLGDVNRVPGGWVKTNFAMPGEATLRVRGFIAGGCQNGSGWFVEDYWGPPLWSAQPTSRTNSVGSTATLRGLAYGPAPLSYQWYKGGMLIVDGARISGATTPDLTLTNVSGADSGGYYLVVSNAYNARTSVVATLTVNDPEILTPPGGLNRQLGESATLSVVTQGTAPLSYQWWKDGAALIGATESSITWTNLRAADAGAYRVVVEGPYGSATSSVAPLTVNQATLDTGFNPRVDNWVYSLAVQPDGKVLVGGNFSVLGGETRSCIGRLNADGTLDAGFNPGANALVYSLVTQPDGKTLVGGYFDRLGGQPRSRIGRLNADGSLDPAFNPGASYYVCSLGVQADGKILVGGDFATLGGQPRDRIGRLNVDGTLDPAFNPGASHCVCSLAIQGDGKILAGGGFTSLGGQPRNRIGRLNVDGTLDTGFDPGADNVVNALVVQADGKILVGGGFTSLGGQPRNRIGRLNADGTLDAGFNPGADNVVDSVVVQADGRILVGGEFRTLSGQGRRGLARLNSDGTLDVGFNPCTSGTVYSMALQADGKILLGGRFTTLGEQTGSYMGRLNATDAATQSLGYNGSSITWLRGGTGPEVWRTVFDWCTDGRQWTPLGEGTRLPGGWQVTNAIVPPQATLRARGFVTGGHQNGSGWFLEDYLGLPVWIVEPTDRNSNAGSTVTFAGLAGGAQPLSYQWFKDGVAISDGACVAGAATPRLTLTNVLGSATGGYQLVVSNVYGARTSVVATLTVEDPVIITPLLSQNRNLGENAILSVTALGTTPLSYQWFKEGVALAGRSEPSLTLTNLGVADAGDYRVMVSSPYGSVTSSVVTLTVNAVTVDSGFKPGANGVVSSLAVQADGKILVGGYFDTLGGEPRSRIGRLCADGTPDTEFNPGADGSVNSLVVQVDGKILLGGGFTTLGGEPRNRIGRLNADGSLDTGFDPGAGYGVHSLVVQPDGKILVGGEFTTLCGQTRNRIGRLNPDGTLDTGFNLGASDVVRSLVLQADGKILVGGWFTTLGGQPRSRIGRLNPDGMPDTAFDTGADSGVCCLAMQKDGKILVGGEFTKLGGQTRNRIARLNADGTLDTEFNPGADREIYTLAVQSDGKILVGGSFTTLGGQTRTRIGRLNLDGTLDAEFNPGASSYVYSLALQADGKTLVGGNFTTLGGQARYYVGRLNATDPATQNLIYNGSTITWLRGGTSPEVWETVFEWSSDGLQWTPLGEVIRVPGGWQRTDTLLPAQVTIRARGFVAGGYGDSSSWFVEDHWGAPGWIAQPLSRTNNAGSTTTFEGQVGGAPPFAYQWLKGGTVITNDAHIEGATTSRLTLTNVLGADAGDYWLVVSNAYGVRTSVVATLTVNDPVITTHPIGLSRQAGEYVTLSVTAQGAAPLGYQWWKDGVVLAGYVDPSITLSNLGAGDGGGYRAVVSSPYGSTTSSVAWLTVNEATLDVSFNPGSSSSVYSLAVQGDGKILVGGDFNKLVGQTRICVGRLKQDGTLDIGFDPGADGSVSSLAMQEDGKILVGGSFSMLGGQPRNRIGRLNPDGTLDAGFNPGAWSSVSSLVVQPDGKILVGGEFTSLGGQARSYLARLNGDGTLDTGFNPGAGAAVSSLAAQADGRILVGGSFTTLGGQPRSRIGRLNADGTLDTSFNPGASGTVSSLTVQADGKVIVGGAFTTLGGQTRKYIGRLNANGTLDTGFNPGADNPVSSLAAQADGKILVGGSFTTLGGQPRSRIGRLNADGTLDTSFNPGASGTVSSLTVQADGKVIVGGAFTTLGGQPRSCIGRLNATAPATQSLSYEGSTITWLRGGTSPEVWRATFDYSTNGVDWVSLGMGTRIVDGWQQTGAVLPSDSYLRARGPISGGYRNASGWFVEDYWGAPRWVAQPVSRTNDAGTTVSFVGMAFGTAPVYQWFKDGVAILDDVHTVGATAGSLVLTNVSGADAGRYHLVVTNVYGCRTSVVATLTVNDPAISVSPVSQERNVGETATLTVTALGSSPLIYQWWKNGMALAGQTESSMTLTNLGVADAGSYCVVVSGPYGSVTSGVALLAVNAATFDTGFNPAASGSVYSLAVQADGRMLVGGTFVALGGQTRNRIGRLNPDGTLDIGFNPGASSYVQTLAVQADGRILVGGDFTTLGGQTRNYIGRLNADGHLDAGFDPGADSSVYSLALQADGKILVGGCFATLGGQPRNRIGRLNPDGTLDTGFNPGASGNVSSLAVQADGKILVGGEFTSLGGQTRHYIGRLNADGTLDNGFNPGANGSVSSLVMQGDGRILVGGTFVTLGGQTRTNVARLNADGTLDTGFNPGASGSVFSIALQADGKILVGGKFTTLGGQARKYIGRLNADGMLDTRFNPGANGSVYSLALQADGRILVGGWFTTLCGQGCNSLGRLIATAPATQSLRYEGSTISWLRGGTGPEVWRTFFDWSSDGLSWTPLGEGTRMTGRWQRTNAIVPAQATIRARGFASGGYQNGSSWFVESLLAPSVPLVAPVLSVESVAGESIWFRLTGGTNAQYVVQTATNLLSAPVEWQPVTTLILTNGWSLFDWTNAGESQRFFRAK